jgi:hypothetical protein
MTGSSASRAYLAIPTTKKHTNNDDLIIRYIFEPSDEGIRYMKHLGYVILKLHRSCRFVPLGKKLQPTPVGCNFKKSLSL